MYAQAATLLYVLWILWLFTGSRKGWHRASAGLWIPLLWLLIVGSRPVSKWLGVETSTTGDNLEGSPLDAFVFLALIVAALVILSKRRANLRGIAASNKWLVAYFVFLGVSVIWSDYSFVSLKRWIKDVGNIIMVLVVLSEREPVEAIRVLLLRCAYVLLPLSAIVIAFYANTGRYWDAWDGHTNYRGVTLDKNLFGSTLVVWGGGLFWSLTRRWVQKSKQKLDIFVHVFLLAMVVGFLVIANSITSLSCTVLSIGCLAAFKLAAFRHGIQRFGLKGLLVLPVLVFLAQAVFDLAGTVVGSAGRDLSLTGRTEIWARCLNVPLNPLLGAGYYSFWEGENVRIISQGFYYAIHEAHNGYLETYLNSGLIGLGLLAGLLIDAAQKIIKSVGPTDSYGALSFAFLTAATIHNVTECTFNRLGPLWFVLLLVIIRYPGASTARVKITSEGASRMKESRTRAEFAGDQLLRRVPAC